MIDFLFLPRRNSSGSLRKFLYINLLPLAGSSFSSLKVFHDCSGGNSRPSRPSGVGGGNFFGDESLVLSSCSCSCPRSCSIKALSKERLSPNVQRLMSKPARSHLISWPTALTLVALIIAAVILIIFLRLETWPARTARQSSAELERLGKNLRAAFVDIAHLQPRITINDRVYMEQTTPVSELVVLSRRIEVEHELLHTWVGSSKRVKLHGTFIVKAGFDLQQNLAVDIRPNEIIVQLPHARILGIEQEQVDVLAFENGLWNRISGQDVQSELSVLPELAWKKAAQSELPAEAEQTLQKQLEQRIHMAQPLHLVFKDEKKSE